MKRAPLALALAAATVWNGSVLATPHDDVRHAVTRTPITHVIAVVGENVTFDALFGTYLPPRGESVRNLLSQRIVNADGSPGPRYEKAVQFEAVRMDDRYTLRPWLTTPYDRLPQPLLTGVYNPLTLQLFGSVPDPRFGSLDVNGPFPITRFVGYGDQTAFGTGDPVHRFFQMWQQTGGTNRQLHSFAWPAITTGQGGDTPGVTPLNPGQGAELMGFFNMAAGDAPYFKALARQYAISDNFHQSIMGGTGANFFSIATGDVAVFNEHGVRAVPPTNQIENPDPLADTANFYSRDGYAGGSYVNCSDVHQPGVSAVLGLLQSLHHRSNCDPGTYYLVNNYEPPYTIDGTPRTLGAQSFVYPPQTVPTIGEALARRGVSWRWYTGGRDVSDVTSDPLYTTIRTFVQSQVPVGTPAAAIDALTFQQTQPLLYNNIGDPHNSSSTVVNGPLRSNLRGLASFYDDVDHGTLPAVSYVVPKNLDSGHPGYSVPALYEQFVKDLVDRVRANPELWASTAIVITTDEGGGYFDSGLIQNLDFFGDGPRVPLIVVSPFACSGRVDHVYNDHASILKFIEYNWSLGPLSSRSRDRLPNPRGNDDSYIPENSPAIGDLTSLFTFSKGERSCRSDR